MAVAAAELELEYPMEVEARLAHNQRDVTEIKGDLRRMDSKIDALSQRVGSRATRSSCGSASRRISRPNRTPQGSKNPTCGSLRALWIAFDAGYRSLRISVLRNRLFELRSELFEAARNGVFGNAKFSDPVYLRTRRILNGSIRFAHQFTVSRLFILLWSSRWWLNPDQIERENAAHDRALREHSPEARELVKNVVCETDVAIVMHMIQINALGFALFTLLDIGFRCFHAQQQIRAAIARHTIRNRRMLEPLERDALYGLERIEHDMAFPKV